MPTLSSEHDEALRWLAKEISASPRNEALALVAYLEQQAKARGDLGCLRVNADYHGLAGMDRSQALRVAQLSRCDAADN